MKKELEAKDKIYLDKFEIYIQQIRKELNTRIIEFGHLKTNKLIFDLLQYCLLQKSAIEKELDYILKTKFNVSKHTELKELVEEFTPNIFNQFRTALGDNNSRYVEMFIEKGLKSFGDRLFRIKDIIIDNDSFKPKEKLLATEFLSKFKVYFQDVANMDEYLNLFAKYFAFNYYENKIIEKTKSIHDFTVSNKELLLFILDELEIPVNVPKEIKLADKDYVILMFLLEEQNLIAKLISLNQKHAALNGIIPLKPNSNINSTINNHYNSVSLKEYLNQTNNFSRREYIANKLRRIANKLDNQDN